MKTVPVPEKQTMKIPPWKWVLAVLSLLSLIPCGTAYAVHDERLKVRCFECHKGLPLEAGNAPFRDETAGVCIRCHKDYHHAKKDLSHPVQVVPSMKVPTDLPLDSKQRMTCVTCHTYHLGYKNAKEQKLYFLRRIKGKTFCYSCHKKNLAR